MSLDSLDLLSDIGPPLPGAQCQILPVKRYSFKERMWRENFYASPNNVIELQKFMFKLHLKLQENVTKALRTGWFFNCPPPFFCGKLVPGRLGPGKLGPRKIGPRKILGAANWAPEIFWWQIGSRQIGPWLENVGAANWAPGKLGA